MKTNSLPQWNLADFYNNIKDPQIQNDLTWCHDQTEKFVSQYQNVFTSNDWDGSALFDAILCFEQIQEKMLRVMSYAGLLYYKHLNDTEILSFYQSTQETLTNIGNELIFFTLDLNKIEQSQLTKAFQDSPELNHYKPWIEQVQRYKDHQLSPELEKMLSEKSLTSSLAWVRLYDETLASLRFKLHDEIHTLSSITNLTTHADEATRFEASKSLSEGLDSQINLFTLITNTLAKDKSIEDRWRNYPSSMSERHLSNQVEPEVVQALVSTVENNYPELSHRYYAIKAELLGKKKLEYWDRNAPLPFSDDEIIEWEDAKNIVLNAYQQFSPTIASIGQKFFDHNWIDVPALEHKTSGAFSHPAVPSVHPYILLNYLGKQRDVMTLAHELGHGVHQVLAAEQGLLISNTPLTLAETASVFGEMLTFRSLLNSCNDKNKKIQLLANKIEDMLNTVVRQIAFYQFEVEVHHRRQKGELSKEDLGQIWLTTQTKALGPSINIDPITLNYWAYISHFIHSPFYVYAYAFGDCLVNSLYASYENQPEGFVEKYIDLLKAGGSKRHKELLTPFNLDASDPNFWQTGLNMIKQLIDELNQLIHG